MAKAHEKLLDEIVERVEKEIAKFQGSIPDTQKRIYDRIIELAKELEVKNGKLVNSVANIKAIGELKSDIEKIVLNQSYINKTMDFAKAFNIVSDLQNSYFASIVVDFKPKKVLNALKNDSIQATVNALTEAGLTANLTEPIQNILRQNITTGGSFADLMEQMRTYITTTTDQDGKKSLGALERYTQQITTDSLNQFSAIYNQTITDDLGFEWFQYSGSLLQTSRPWCVHMVKKRYVHKSELQTVIDDNIDGVDICSEDIPCNPKTGLPKGMIKGTNASNIQTRRGGYQCGHQFGGVPDALVPAELRNKFKTAV